MKKLLQLLNLSLILLMIVSLFNSIEVERVSNTLFSFSESRTQNAVQTTADIIAAASPAVISINVYKAVPVHQYGNGTIRGVLRPLFSNITHKVGSGSGFFITEDGYLLTNKHVVSDEDASYTVNLSEDTELQAQVVYRDPDVDLAVVKVEGNNFSAVRLADSSKLKISQDVITIGNAMGQFTDSVSYGNIVALRQNITVSDKDGFAERISGLIRTNAKLYPGDSGGPLLNSKGEVIGINTATTIGSQRRVASFAIPVNRAKETIREAGISAG